MGILGNERTRLRDPLTACRNMSRQNFGLRARPAFGQATGNQNPVNAIARADQDRRSTTKAAVARKMSARAPKSSK